MAQLKGHETQPSCCLWHGQLYAAGDGAGAQIVHRTRWTPIVTRGGRRSQDF